MELLLCTIKKYYTAIAECLSICGKANKLIDLSKDITGADKWQLVKIIVIIIIILIPFQLLEAFDNFFGYIETLCGRVNFSFYDAVVREKNVN